MIGQILTLNPTSLNLFVLSFELWLHANFVLLRFCFFFFSDVLALINKKNYQHSQSMNWANWVISNISQLDIEFIITISFYINNSKIN